MNTDARLSESFGGAWRSGREDSSQCDPESPRDYLRFRRGEHKRWREEHVIAATTIDTALRWIGENIFGERGLADSLGDVVFAGEWLARGFVFYELNAEEEAATAYFAHVWV
jgi:hypothetical protein